MTLIEVAIATFLLALFAVAFITGQGSNVVDSAKFKRELRLRDLAELKMNELILDPPEFRQNLTDAVLDTKPFPDFPNYEYTVELKKFTVPDLTKIMGGGEEDGSKQKLREKIFGVVKENMEKMIWQVVLTVVDKENGGSHTVASWLFNGRAKVNLGAF